MLTLQSSLCRTFQGFLPLSPIVTVRFTEAAQTKQHQMDLIERGRSWSNCRLISVCMRRLISLSLPF